MKNHKDLLDLIHYLTERGLKIINETDNDGWSALMHICDSTNPSKVEIAEYLIYNGIDINAHTKDDDYENNMTDALLLAIHSRSYELIKLLLDNGSDIDAVVIYGYSVDAWSCVQGRIEEECSSEVYDYICGMLYPHTSINDSQYINKIDWKSAFALMFEYDEGFGAIYDDCDRIPSYYEAYINLPEINYDDWYLYKTWRGRHVSIYQWKTNINATDNAILIETDHDTGKLTIQNGDDLMIGGCDGCHPVIYTKNISWGSSHGESSFECRNEQGEVDLRVVIDTLQEYLNSHLGNSDSDSDRC